MADKEEKDYNKWLKSLGEEKIKQTLKDLLNSGLEGINQEYSFKIVNLDLTPGEESLTVKFDVVAYPPDNYVGFRGY
jgi:hypothetical protein